MTMNDKIEKDRDWDAVAAIEPHQIFMWKIVQKSLDKMSTHMKPNLTAKAYQNFRKLFCPSIAAVAPLSPENLEIPLFKVLPQDELMDE